jgi:mono/diheme cytochrome c family protein
MYVYTSTSKKIWLAQILGAFMALSWLSGCGQPLAPAPLPELVSIQAQVFDAACVECHRAGFASGELDLSDAATSAQSLIRVPATNRVAHENGWVLVEPGAPGLSFLMRKLRNPGVGEGAAMPPGTHELTDACVELIAEWIRQLGAQGAAL